MDTTTSTINIIRYRPGAAPVALRELPPLDQIVDKELLWIDLINPSVGELSEVLLEILPKVEQDVEVQSRILEMMQVRHRRPHVQTYQHANLVVAMLFELQKDSLRFGEVQILFGKNYIVTIQRHSFQTQQPLRQYLEKQPLLLERGADYVAAELLDMITDQHAEHLLRIEKQVERTESHFFSGRPKQRDIRQIHRLRRELLRIYHAMHALPDLLRRLNRQHQHTPLVEADSHGYFYEIADRVAHQTELIAMLRETLAFSFEAGMMLMQLEQDDTTRKLAAWAAIIAIPTAVAGIYGMNFENMPELNFRFAYPAVLAAMGGICFALYRKFKRIKWL